MPAELKDPAQMTDPELEQAVEFEVMKYEDGDGQWWCPSCNDWVHGCQVSYAQVHQREGCRSTVQVHREREDEFRPTTDWNHTMEVVAKMKQTRFEFYICWVGSGVDISISTEGDPVKYRSKEAPQRSICIAAIQAVRS